MARIEQRLAEAFVCARCAHRGARAEKLAMSGTGLSRIFDIQSYRYAFLSCTNCGYTEVYNLRTLEARDDLDFLLDTLFVGDSPDRALR